MDAPSKVRLTAEEKNSAQDIRKSFFGRLSSRLPAAVIAEQQESVIHHIISDARPLKTVESISFMTMLRKHNPKAEMLTVYRAKNMISKEFIKFKNDLIEMLTFVSYVCLTADIWSAKHRSFLGLTIHWLDDNLKRVSMALAVKRFKGIKFHVFYFTFLSKAKVPFY